MTPTLSSRREDYYRFHRVQAECKDMDPAYPVLRHLAGDLGLSIEGRTWLVVCFTAYYHLGSALRAFQETTNPRHAAGAALDLPVATERRGHWYRPRLARHLEAVQTVAREEPDGLSGWLLGGLYGTPEENWATVQHRAAALPGNGRWASFKTTELLQQVCGALVAAPDMQHAHSSGPRRGLELLYASLPTGNDPADIAVLDRVSASLVTDMKRRRIPATMETVETSLCDFASLVKGKYYPGHDIDQMQLQLSSVPSGYSRLAWDARRKTLPEAYLGELHGRSGLDRERMICYRTTGKIPERGAV